MVVSRNRVNKLLFGSLFIVLVIVLIPFTMREAEPWWGLLDNPAADDGVGTTWESQKDESGIINVKIRQFYNAKKRLPHSFQELDNFAKSKAVNPLGEISDIPKIGHTAANPKHVQQSQGYNTKNYSLVYTDGSSCQFQLLDHGYKMSCTRRDYWLGGRMAKEKVYVNDSY